MAVSDTIARGIEQRIIAFDEENRNVIYVAQNKKYRLSDPEEIVRAEAYVSLILDYGYPAGQIALEYPVPQDRKSVV